MTITAAPPKGKNGLRQIFRPFEVKKIDDEARTFTGLAGAFSLDFGGDVIEPGAFKRTLSDWRRSKKILPFMDSHRYSTVRSVVGKMVEAEEVKDGLEATFEVIDGPDGDEIWRRIKGRYVNGLSIGYEPKKVRQPSETERLRGIWRFLEEVKLREISVVIWPMNPDAVIDAAAIKALIAAKSSGVELTEEQLAELRELYDDVGALLEKSASAEDPAAAKPDGEEPDGDAALGDPPSQEDAKGLAPDDPRRLELDSMIRGLMVAGLDG